MGDLKRFPFPQRPPGRPVTPIEEKFWKKVDKGGSDECWEWTGKLNHSGYGILCTGPRANRKRTRAHRISWEIHNGPIPERKLVLHKCDNKKCVNPNHLYLGTHSNNMQDAWDRGRQPRERPNCRGLNHGKAKLSDDDVREIRRLWKKRVRRKALSEKYGVSPRHIWAVATGRARKYVDKEE